MSLVDNLLRLTLAMLLSMITVGEALAIVLGAARRLGMEQVALTAAQGRVLAEPLEATRDVPPFRNTAMDGYAVRAADVADASRDHPVSLRLLEVVGAGAVPQLALTRGAA